jgi:hypothetical protein
MALCAQCRSIPPELITSADWPPYTDHENIRVEHHASWTDLKNSASAGCPCCQALIFLIGIEEAPAIQIPILLEKNHWESFVVHYQPSEEPGWLLPQSVYAETVPGKWSELLFPGLDFRCRLWFETGYIRKVWLLFINDNF